MPQYHVFVLSMLSNISCVNLRTASMPLHSVRYRILTSAGLDGISIRLRYGRYGFRTLVAETDFLF
jgi:hypothetical protein